jgi:hypothetical protein
MLRVIEKNMVIVGMTAKTKAEVMIMGTKVTAISIKA